MWLAAAAGDTVAATDPIKLELPTGLEAGKQLSALAEDTERVLLALGINNVVILDPEPNNRLTFAQSRRRVTGETLVALAAARLDCSCDHLSRRRLRSLLDLPAGGDLSTLSATLIDSPLAPHWKKKRDLAALAALAGEREIHAAG